MRSRSESLSYLILLILQSLYKFVFKWFYTISNILFHTVYLCIIYVHKYSIAIAMGRYVNIFWFCLITENRGEFLEKLQRARAQVKPNTPSQPILSRPGPTRLVVGNWALASRKEGELHIHNSDGQQVIVSSISRQVLSIYSFVIVGCCCICWNGNNLCYLFYTF